MSGARVPPGYHGPALAPCVVGRPAASATALAWSDAAAFLQGRAHMACVGSVSRMVLTGGGTNDYYLGYVRSRSARVLRVVCELNVFAGATPVTATLAPSLTGATTIGNAAPLDGSSALPLPSAALRRGEEYERYFDVSGLTVGTLTWIRVTVGAGTGTHQGLYRLSAYEVPRAALDPASAPSVDGGLNPAWGLPRGDVFAGSGSTAADAGAGMERVLHQLDSARTEGHRTVLSLCTVEDTTYCWIHAGTGALADFVMYTTGYAPTFRVRARRIGAASATGSTNKIAVRYNINHASGATFRVTRADGTTTDVTLANTAGAWAVATQTLPLSTANTDQEDTLAFRINAPGGTNCYVSAIYVYDQES